MKFIFTFFMSFGFIAIFDLAAQELVNINTITSCEKAMTISSLQSFGPTTAPLSENSNVNAFGPQKRQAWYKFSVEKDGKLLLDINPLDSTDNYDFALFKAESANTCKKIQEQTLLPVRSNFDKIAPNNQGKTGLSIFGDEQSYSPSIAVRKGEIYFLNVLSMYESSGHSITFTYLETFNIFGKIVNENNQDVHKAKVSLYNLRNNERCGLTDDLKKGEFQLEVSINTEPHKFPQYRLEVFAPKYIIKDTIIESKDILKLKDNHINFNLAQLKKGVNESFGHIYFDPNSPNQVVPSSYAILDKLVKTMKLNPEIIIIAEGHTNGFYPSTEVDNQLSEGRAEAVKKYLISQNIDASRIKVKGFGSTALKFPKAESEFEESQNRRVEINFEKIKK